MHAEGAGLLLLHNRARPNGGAPRLLRFGEMCDELTNGSVKGILVTLDNRIKKG